MASLVERWIESLARLVVDVSRKVRPVALVEAVEREGGFTIGREVDEFIQIGPDGAVVSKADKAPELPNGTAVAVHLGESHRIIERIAYPSATRSYLAAVIGNQIDRLGPFEENDAVFSWRSTPQAKGANTIEVVVSIASRRRILETVRPLVLAGFVPARVTVADDEAAPSILVTLGSDEADISGVRRAVTAAIVGIALLGFAGFGVNWWLKGVLDQKLSEAVAMLATKSASVEKASQERSLFSDDQQRIAEIAADKERGSMLPILQQLSAILPDSAYLTRLDLEGETLRIAGYAANAAGLIPLLEQDEMMTNVHFVAPLARVSDQDRISFELELKWQRPVAP